MSGAIRMHDEMLLAACKYGIFSEEIAVYSPSYLIATDYWTIIDDLLDASPELYPAECCECLLSVFSFQTAEALACQVSQEHYDKGMTFPPFSNIRTISANIAAKVAAKAYDLG